MTQAIRCLLVIALCLISTLPVRAQDDFKIEELRAVPGLNLCGEPVPVVLPHVRERFEKEMLLALGNRAQALLWMKRVPRYMPFIEASLKANNMPEDLKYLAVAESALLPHAGSAKGAIGYWQLMPDTARKYGLRVDADVDERRNIHLSTPAAINYLLALHGQFKSWTLSMAAYNMGEEGLRAEMLEQNTQDYYNLYLPLETQQFIFRILAVKLIIGAPVDYGFRVKPEDYYQPIVFDTVDLDCFQETPIRLVAEAAGTFFKTVKDLNPHLRGHYLQPGHLQINLPQGSAGGFNARFEQLAAKHHAAQENRIYIIREGDSLSAIAERFEVPLAALLIWNRIGLHDPIHPGDRLVIYPGSLEQLEP